MALSSFEASNLPVYGHRRATGNRGGFTTEKSVVSLSAILHCGVPADIPSIQSDARMRARVLVYY